MARCVGLSEGEAMTGTGWQVPSYRTDVFFPRRSRYCLCVFVLNEGARIRSQLRKMRNLATEIDILVADGGSTDGAVAPDVLEASGVRALLTKTGPGKLSAQMRMALAFALEEGYEGVVVVDGNDKDDTSAAVNFVHALDRGYDHVQGSRYVPGGRAVNTPSARHWGVKLLHAPLISAASGFRFTDTTNGFRAYSRRLLEDPGVSPFRDVFSAYELHYYLAIRSVRLGYRAIEIPVTRAYPLGKPPSKISSVKGNLGILATLFRACLGRLDP